jgi:hypothetical protein
MRELTERNPTMYLPTPDAVFSNDYGTIARYGEYDNPYILVTFNKYGNWLHTFMCFQCGATAVLWSSY